MSSDRRVMSYVQTSEDHGVRGNRDAVPECGVVTHVVTHWPPSSEGACLKEGHAGAGLYTPTHNDPRRMSNLQTRPKPSLWRNIGACDNNRYRTNQSAEPPVVRPERVRDAMEQHSQRTGLSCRYAGKRHQPDSALRRVARQVSKNHRKEAVHGAMVGVH